MKYILILVFPLLLISCRPSNKTEDLFSMQKNVQSRWASFENPKGIKGGGAITNKGAKGHPSEKFGPHERKVLCDIKGSGVIRRIWLTISKRDPKTLRALKIEMYWDNSEKPAVQAPLGDFFCNILGETSTFENELFSNPEGRSFNCCIPMPFKTAARIVITNESDETISHLFYDVDYELNKSFNSNSLYFHAWWNRDVKTQIGKDYTILPTIKGKGRYLGTHIGVIADSVYKGFWWGEGEFKVYLDGDTKNPTLAGTGTEDFAGSAWGLGKFNNRFQGCLVNDEKSGKYAFYRYHVKDRIFFYQDISITMQQIGGGWKADVEAAIKKGVPLKPTSIDGINGGAFVGLLDQPPANGLDDPSLPKEGFMIFYRSDDWSSVAYFYLDKPENDLPEIQNVAVRLKAID